MRNLRNKNAPPVDGLVEQFIGSAYDTVKLVSDNIALVIAVGEAIEGGTIDDFLSSADVDTLAKLNALVLDATLGSIETLATVAQGALADTALQPTHIDTLAKLQAYVLDQAIASEAYVDLAVAGLYDDKGGYDANTNTPDLTVTPSGIERSDAYTVTVGGTFFTAPVDPADLLIALQDDPTLESHWNIINRNIDESAFATAAQGAKADTALQPEDVGTAAGEDIGAFATAAQGSAADSALQYGSKSIIVELPSNTEDLSFFFTDAALTVTKIRPILVGATPSVTWTLRHGLDRNGVGSEIVIGGTITTEISTGIDILVFNDPTIAANSHVWLETTDKSGTVNSLGLTLFYDED